MADYIDDFYKEPGSPFAVICQSCFPAFVLHCSDELQKRAKQTARISAEKEELDSEDRIAYLDLLCEIALENADSIAFDYGFDAENAPDEFRLAKCMTSLLFVLQSPFIMCHGRQFLIDILLLNMIVADRLLSLPAQAEHLSSSEFVKYYLAMILRLFPTEDTDEFSGFYENRLTAFSKIVTVPGEKELKDCFDLIKQDLCVDGYKNHYVYDTYENKYHVAHRDSSPKKPLSKYTLIEFVRFEVSYLKNIIETTKPFFREEDWKKDLQLIEQELQRRQSTQNTPRPSFNTPQKQNLKEPKNYFRVVIVILAVVIAACLIFLTIDKYYNINSILQLLIG